MRSRVSHCVFVCVYLRWWADRMKGVLALDVGEGKFEQLVYQGVHMNYSGELHGLIEKVRPPLFRSLPSLRFMICDSCRRPCLALSRQSHRCLHQKRGWAQREACTAVLRGIVGRLLTA
jgi:hypothetical protein